MISLPWQVFVALIAANAVIIIALIYFIRDMTQEKNGHARELVRNARDDMRQGLREGHQIFVELLNSQTDDEPEDPDS